jgi:hypothetical protein
VELSPSKDVPFWVFPCFSKTCLDVTFKRVVSRLYVAVLVRAGR